MERIEKVKKILIISLALTLAFSLCACSELEKLKSELPPLPDTSATASPEPSAEPSPEATEAQEESTAVQAGPRVMVNIKNTTIQEYDPADGSQLILTFAYETPSVYIEGRSEASAAINEYIALLDETYYTGNDYGVGSATGFNLMLQQAQDNYSYVVGTGAVDLPLELASSQTVSVARADERILSLVYSYYEFTGGVHGNYVDRAYVFDSETGEELTLDKLTTDFDAFTAFMVQYMVEKAENEAYYSERIDPNTLAREQYSAAFGALLREGSWYFGSEGLTVFSDAYEFGPYAAGSVEFTVPYEALEGVIDEKWFPAERSGEGEFIVKPLSEVSGGDTEIIDMVTVSDEGQELCLVSLGNVYDVKLSQVEYMDRFYETAQLWHCSYMNDCALQLKTLIPEGIPNLMLSYATADGASRSLLISRSGQDGSFTLVEEGSIEAVG